MAYTPRRGSAITTLQELVNFVEEEFRRISIVLSEQIEIELRQRGRAPLKPREGMIVSADGAGWNPGSGAGAYEYKGGAWVKL